MRKNMLGLVDELGIISANMDHAAELKGCDLCCHLHKESDQTFFLYITTLDTLVFSVCEDNWLYLSLQFRKARQ